MQLIINCLFIKDFRFSILTSSMITSASILNIINFLIDDEMMYNRVVLVLTEYTAIEIVSSLNFVNFFDY
jgi:hypothetical protein